MEQVTGENSERLGFSKNRRKIFQWLLLVGSVVFIVFLIVVRGEKIPEFEGRPISEYLPDLRTRWVQLRYEAAIIAIESVGTNGLPYYVRQAYAPPTWFEIHSERISRSYRNTVTIAVNKWIYSDVAKARRAGARDALRYLKDNIDAHPITNDLARIMYGATKQDVYEIARLIDSFGGDSVAVVIPWLSESDASRIKWACRVISNRGAAGSNAVPALVELFKRDSTHTDQAFYALRKVGDASRPAFAEALRSEQASVRLLALNYVRTDPAMFEHVSPLLYDLDPAIRSRPMMTIVGWRLWGRNILKPELREEETGEYFERVVEMEWGREELLRVIEEVFDGTQEFEKVRLATVYCLYDGENKSFLTFLQDRAAHAEDRTKRLEAARALKSIRAFQQISNGE